MIRAAERWRAIKVTDFERRQMAAVKADLDQEYEARNGLAKEPSGDARCRESSEIPFCQAYLQGRAGRGNACGSDRVFGEYRRQAPWVPPMGTHGSEGLL